MAELGLIPTRTAAIGKGIDIDWLVRSILLGAMFLALWISFRPFMSLAESPEVNEAGNVINQVGYSLLFLLLAAWCMMHQPARLTLLARPVLAAALLWLVFSAVVSWEPMLSARRLAFTFVAIASAAIVPLLPKNIRHFSDVLTVVVLVVLALCYLGVFLIPTLSIHQASDFGDDLGLAGDWRGVFGNKNAAGGAMALFVLIGLFVARMRSLTIGTAIVVLAATFLIFTHSKTSIITLPLTLIVSFVIMRIRRPVFGVAFALAVVAVLNFFAMGSVFFEPVRDLLSAILTDPSFTGRDDVWRFAFDHMIERPLTGYGFAAFWGTPQVVFGPLGDTSWATVAGSAHNAYLDLALTVGIPGAILVTLWLVVLPLIDFYRSPKAPHVMPLEMLFLRVCLIAALSSCFESALLPEGMWPLFLLSSAFGLRFLSMSRVSA